MSIFQHVPELPPDPILGLPIAFAADSNPKKINLGIGAYKTAAGEPLVLNSVKHAEHLILQKNLNKEYLPIEGDREFIQCSLELLFGPNHPLLSSGCLFANQTVGGASALRTGADFLKKNLATNTIFIPQPTWSNHKQIFEAAGLSVGSYPYFSPANRTFDFEGMVRATENMPRGSIILLHGCCQNPTGLDPTFEEWKILSTLIKEKGLIPFFDIAYQGFGDDLDTDAQAIRYFAQQGHEMLVAYSYSKNFGLYGERVGFLTVIFSDSQLRSAIASQVRRLIRSNYSNPPLHGARIVTTILKSYNLSEEWKKELHNMSERIREMRKALIAELLVKGNDPALSSMQYQKGLFCYLELSTSQIERLRVEKGIYIPKNRLSVAGLNTHNLAYVADSLLSVIKGS